jgi:hypothetical protein
MNGYPVDMDTDDRWPRPRWFLWLVVFLIPIPFSPWWLTVVMLGIVTAIITVAVGFRTD